MLSEAVNRHIELYQSMGFKYKVQAYMLHSFADLLKAGRRSSSARMQFWNGRRALHRSASAMIACSILRARRLISSCRPSEIAMPPNGYFARL
jgi:hypothetical protein